MTSRSAPKPALTLSLALATTCGAAFAQSPIDTSDRNAVASFYHTWFHPSRANVTPNWTGDANGCNPGTIDPAHVQAVVDRISAYRILAGDEAVRLYDQGSQEDEQKGALMLQTSGVIGQQSLPTSTPCWSQDGDFALFRSIQDHAVGTNAIDRMMNGAVGGLSQAMLMQPTASWIRIGSTNSHMLVNRLNATRFPNTGQTSWPGRGYQPYQLVPDMWCFTAQDQPWSPGQQNSTADYSQATVSVTRAGQPVQINVIRRNWRAWVWSGINWTFAPGELIRRAGMPETTYDVVIDNIRNTLVTRYSYSVTIFDPSASAGAETFGAGCGSRSARTFHERFPAGSADLDGTSVVMTPDGAGGYLVTNGIDGWRDHSFPTSVPLGDDDVATNLALPFTFAYPGGSTNAVDVSSNGYVYLQPGSFNGDSLCCDGNLTTFQNGPAHVAVFGQDLDPSSGGNVYFETGFNNTAVYITWWDVPEYNTGNLQRVQLQLHADGKMVIAWLRAINQNRSALVGFRSGYANDPSLAIDTTRPPSVDATLGMAAASWPILGTTCSLVFGNYAQSGLGALNLGLQRSSIDLATIGMPNCMLLNQPLLSISQNMPVSPATFALPLPNSAALVGVQLHTQGVAMAPGVNALGVLATNGLTLTLGR